MRSEDSIGASSATYRRATITVAKKLKVPSNHTQFPSEDFHAISETIPEKPKKKALKWYKMGIKRGFNKATSMMLEKEFRLKHQTLYGPEKIKFNVRTKFDGK